jgi:hypothetical protein
MLQKGKHSGLDVATGSCLFAVLETLYKLFKTAQQIGDFSPLRPGAVRSL